MQADFSKQADHEVHSKVINDKIAKDNQDIQQEIEKLEGGIAEKDLIIDQITERIKCM